MPHQSVRLVSTALEGIPFDLCRVERSEDIHGLYRYDVEVSVGEPESLRGRTLWRSRVTLVFVTDGVAAPVHGMVAELSQQEDARLGRVCLRFTVVPRVWDMTRTTAQEIFVDLSVPEIVARKLKSAGFQEGEDFILDLPAGYPRCRQVIQDERSDYDFIVELCEGTGLSLSFEHVDGRDVLVVEDVVCSLPSRPFA